MRSTYRARSSLIVSIVATTAIIGGRAGAHGGDIHLEHLGSYQPPDVGFNQGVSEIVSYDAEVGPKGPNAANVQAL